MLKHLKQHAVGYVALLVALGGTSYAAVTLPKGSVGKRQLKSESVTNSKVKQGSLRADRFAAGELPDSSATYTVRTQPMPGSGGPGVTSATASCLPGEVATGGGHARSPLPNNADDNVQIIVDAPKLGDGSKTPTGWTVAVRGEGNVPVGNTPTVYAVCAKPE